MSAEAPTINPERLPAKTFQKEPGFQGRVMLGLETFSDINNNAREDITPADIIPLENQNLSLLNKAATQDNLNAYNKPEFQNTSGAFDADKAYTAWREQTTKTFTTPENSEKLTKLKSFFDKIGVNTTSFTSDQCDKFYDRYLNNNSLEVYKDAATSKEYITADTKTFIQDVIAAHIKTDGTIDYAEFEKLMPEYIWVAQKLFAPPSLDMIMQTLDGNAEFKADPQGFIDKRFKKPVPTEEPRAHTTKLSDQEKEWCAALEKHKVIHEYTPEEMARFVEIQKALDNPQQQQLVIQELPNIIQELEGNVFRQLLLNPSGWNHELVIVMAGLQPLFEDYRLAIQKDAFTQNKESFNQFVQVLKEVGVATEIIPQNIPTEEGNHIYLRFYNPDTLAQYTQQNQDLCPPFRVDPHDTQHPFLSWINQATDDEQLLLMMAVANGYPRSFLEDYHNKRGIPPEIALEREDYKMKIKTEETFMNRVQARFQELRRNATQAQSNEEPPTS